MSGRILPLAFLVLLALHIALLFSIDIYPLIDLPYHLSGAMIARGLDNPAAPFADYYALEIWPNPNVAHLLFCSQPFFPNVEAANRIFLLFCLILLPLALLRVTRRIGGDPWAALLGFLLVYHYSFSWGFVGFALGVPLVLLGLDLLLRLDARPTWGGRLGLAALLLALYFVHLLTALFLAFVVLLTVLGRLRGAARRRAEDALALLPLLAMVCYWQITQSAAGDASPLTELARYYARDFLPTFPRRAAFFFWDNFALYPGVAGYAIATLFSGAIAAWALCAAWRRRRATAGRLRGGTIRPAGIFLIAALLAYLLLPQKIPGTAHLYERFAVFVLLALVLQGSQRMPAGSELRRPWLRRAVILALGLLHLGLWTGYYRGFAAHSASFSADVLPPADRPGRLAALICDYDYRGRPVYNHFPDYYTIWKRGITVSKVGDYRFYPVRRRASLSELPAYSEWIGKWGQYDGRYAGLEYILVRGTLPPELRDALTGYAPLRRSGRWTLYQIAS